MAKNLKRDYLKKLSQITTTNGYKVDLANYIYNPSHEHEYPTLKKLIEETDDTLTFKEYQYFKYFDGSGEYLEKVYSMPNDDNQWHVVRQVSEKVLETGNRFNLNKLVQFAEAN